MPTRAGYATVGFAVCCLIAGRLFGLFELYIVGAAAFALVACAIAWVVLNWRSLEVVRGVNPPRLHAGAESIVTLSLSNRRFIPTPVARVTDEVDGVPRADAQVPPLRRGRVTRASYRVPTQQRGLIGLGPMRTTVSDPFAFALTRRTTAPDTALMVLPAFDRVAPPPRPGGSVATRSDRSPGRIGAHGDEFSSLRDYVVGDDLRKVHWPTTARSGELVVRTEHAPEHGHSLVLLDVRASIASPDTFERMVSAATSVLVACRERGDLIRFATTAGDELPGDDDREFDRILDRLALIAQSAGREVRVAQDPTQRAEAAVVIAGSDPGLLEQVGPRHGLPASTLVVEFDGSGARTMGDASRLPSRRMVTVGPQDDFAVLWSALLGTGPQSSAPNR